MATGNVESWTGQILDIGPIYPFVGSEFVLFFIALVVWIGWHVIQIRMESKEFEEDTARIRRDGGIGKALERDQS
jgi:hypothetical protein